MRAYLRDEEEQPALEEERERRMREGTSLLPEVRGKSDLPAVLVASTTTG